MKYRWFWNTNCRFSYEWIRTSSSEQQNLGMELRWTTVASLNTGRAAGSSAGNQTAGIAFGGTVPPFSAATESWNGSSWTTVNSMNTARRYITGAGTQTAAIGAGGYQGTGVTFYRILEWNFMV
jgi:hypothetical protein